jgi:histidine decarboxylase
MPNEITEGPAAMRALDDLYERLAKRNRDALGYPAAKDFDCTPLLRFLQLPLNNVGDPFAESTYQVETRPFEREVLSFFAQLLRAPADDWWGYVTNGGTEGNLYGLYLARELHPGGIVYFSEHTHYSVSKNLHFLGMRHIMIRAQDNGEIDYDDLRETLRVHRDVPPIIFANVGTTMTEARDDVARIAGIMNSMAIRSRYVHADAALCGAYAPFAYPRPAFDFADGADSVSISGHKFLGSPMPCGVVLARKHNVSRIARSVDYIGSLDTTISGSRNGFTPLVLWHRIKTLGFEGLRRRADDALAVAAYAVQRLREAGVPAWRNENALTVVFPRVPDELRDKWQLATQGSISHFIAMPGITKDLVDALVEDLRCSTLP